MWLSSILVQLKKALSKFYPSLDWDDSASIFIIIIVVWFVWFDAFFGTSQWIEVSISLIINKIQYWSQGSRKDGLCLLQIIFSLYRSSIFFPRLLSLSPFFPSSHSRSVIACLSSSCLSFYLPPLLFFSVISLTFFSVFFFVVCSSFYSSLSLLWLFNILFLMGFLISLSLSLSLWLSLICIPCLVSHSF